MKDAFMGNINQFPTNVSSSSYFLRETNSFVSHKNFVHPGDELKYALNPLWLSNPILKHSKIPDLISLLCNVCWFVSTHQTFIDKLLFFITFRQHTYF